MYGLSLLGQHKLEFTDDLKSAYNDAISLKLMSASKRIEDIKLADPDNDLVYLIEDYIDFFTLFIQEEEEAYRKLKDNKDRRMLKLERSDKSSPYYLFAQAEVHLHWATVRLKFDEKLAAAREVYKAYHLLKKNQERFPAFIANKKSLSVIHALAESIPSWIRKLAGIEGSIARGKEEIEEIIAHSRKHDFEFTEEAYGIYAYILFYQSNEREKAYQVLKNSPLDAKSSPLVTFLLANMAHKTGRNDEAIAILNNKPEGEAYLPFYYLDFMLGKFKLYGLSEDAKDHILLFLNQFKGRHFIKEGYQKLAWYELAVKGDLAGYKKRMAACQTKGYRLIDEDIQAYDEASGTVVPNDMLLKARMLFDGGYYTEAYKVLILKSHLFPEGSLHYEEYNYRLGRIQHLLSNYPEALNHYAMVMQISANQHSFMACNAALQSGLIYEDQGHYNQAKKFYDRCLEMEPHEYKSSLHQKAKSGINRLKEKRS